ncbi:MAG TPA: efflux RND transporter periplasmic adaptor subunit [Terriglobales bacterium]|nr:efflux RND transporter periplasmic adaptor subunit [Terriglobales bacterium]
MSSLQVVNPPSESGHQLPGDPGRERRPIRKAGLLIGVLVLVLLVAGAVTIFGKFSEKHALAAETERLAVPSVAVTHPTQEQSHEELVLPATIQAYKESPIYARTNGYVLHWYKDIGAHVNKGELLAEIDTPEVDQELLQARATRQQIQAQLGLAKSSAERWQNLRKSDSVSQQELDQQVSGYQQAQANLAAADANVRRLEQMESFKHIYAPFSGVLTKRTIDVGTLINAGNSGPDKELFDVAQVDPLRVYVNVPQTYSPAIVIGMKAFLEQGEYAGQKVEGKVVRTSEAIDPATRTLLTEIDVPNPTGRILPGAYAQVHFAAKIDAPRLTVPINTLLFRAEGPRAAVVGPDKKVQLKTITIGRDYGSSVELISGLQPSDQIIVNPADSLEDGQEVNVAAPKQQSTEKRGS